MDAREIADLCEKAAEPSRELDCRVASVAHPSMAGEFRVVGPPTYEPERYFSEQEGVDWIGYDLLNNAPRYTASLDAAMALVPKGWRSIIRQHDGGTFARCETLDFKSVTWGKGDTWITETTEGQEAKADAATPALALTAAALRAHAIEQNSHVPLQQRPALDVNDHA